MQGEKPIPPILELPGEIIDIIATHLDIRSLIQLQMTCRGLFPKCLDAQRLKELHFDEISFNYDEEKKDEDEVNSLVFGIEEDAFRLNERQFRATRFRFHATALDFRIPIEQIEINKAKECLVGRGTVDRLEICGDEVVGRMDFVSFDQLIRDLNMFYLGAGVLPEEFCQMPSIKRMKEVKGYNFSTMPLTYLAQTDIEKCDLSMEFNSSDSSDLNPALKKWAEGQLKIKSWEFTFIRFDEQKFFKDFHIVSIRDFVNDEPLRRPLVIRREPVGNIFTYWVKKGDGTQLNVQYNEQFLLWRGGILNLFEEEMDDEDLFDDSDVEMSDVDDEDEEGMDDDGSDDS